MMLLPMKWYAACAAFSHYELKSASGLGVRAATICSLKELPDLLKVQCSLEGVQGRGHNDVVWQLVLSPDVSRDEWFL